MNKKQIAALAMCVATAATAVVGGTLAYFTDKGDVNNVFTIGNLDINLYEKAGVKDSNGNVIQEIKDKEETGFTYSDLVPTYEIIKQPVIENLGSYDAYVRVAVVMNNVSAINDAIDDVYEGKDYTDEQIQEVYDKVFDGWGLSYIRRESGDPDVDTRRLWMDERTDNHVLFDGQIDMYCNLDDYGMYDVNNTFKSETDTDPEGFDYACAGYYHNAAKVEERVYVFYLKLDGKEGDTVDTYTLFDGLNVPADFTAEQMAMFNNLKIDIYADAIQVAGFASAEAAFNALEAEHPLGYWNVD